MEHMEELSHQVPRDSILCHKIIQICLIFKKDIKFIVFQHDLLTIRSNVCYLYIAPQCLKHSLGDLHFNYALPPPPVNWVVNLLILEGWMIESTLSQLPEPRIKLRLWAKSSLHYCYLTTVPYEYNWCRVLYFYSYFSIWTPKRSQQTLLIFRGILTDPRAAGSFLNHPTAALVRLPVNISALPLLGTLY